MPIEPTLTRQERERLDGYRSEHLTFHQNRITIFMSAARAIKGFSDPHDGPDPIPEPFYSLVAQLVRQARLENQILRWWNRMSHDDLVHQMGFWER
jgi:hypothetical protein